MPMTTTMKSLLLALPLLLPLAAGAQDYGDDEKEFGPEQGEWETTLSGSGSNDNDFDAGGFGATGELGYFFSDNAEVFFRQTLNFADSDTGDDSLLGITRVGVDYHFPIGRFHPFIGANIGGVYGNETQETFTAAPEAGVKIYALETTFFFAQAEYQFFFDNASSADESFEDGLFAYTVGVGFNF